MRHRRREVSVGIAIALLALVLAIVRPAYFSAENLSDLLLANLPVLFVALGMTLVILTGEIDISVGSQFAVCGVVAGLLAKSTMPAFAAAAGACFAGALLGTINGSLVAFAGIPSIVVTLATMVGLRDMLRWTTQGAWIENLPQNFQWLGSSLPFYHAAILAAAVALTGAVAWGLRNLAAGRAVVATGSNAEAARLMGIHTNRVKASVFCVTGALTGLASALNAARFNQVPINAGLGLEMKVIAAVVVGGASITGGTGGISGAILGVILLGMIGPALTFLGISAWWEKALQGGIILAAVVVDAIRARGQKRETVFVASRV